jgi:SAM-dependent methyltransferase
MPPRPARPARDKRAPKAPPTGFDAAYYERYYLDPATQVVTPEQHAKLVCGVVSLIEWFGCPLDSVLDVGAGVGRWGDWLREHRPRVEVVSTELDPETCARYGHLQADIRTLRLPRRFDLVVCQGVLPYLDDRDAERGIENLAVMTEEFLFLEAITANDLEQVCDLSRTDVRVHARSGAWYQTRLGRHYRRVGAGLFHSRGGELHFYELEAGR